jgi:predicted GIY-YIG superfamily endonuclease
MASKTTKEFIADAIKIHGNKYSYPRAIYINRTRKLIITCGAHGDFEQVAENHLSGNGCPACGNVLRKTTEQFIAEASIAHNNKYSYEKTKYINKLEKVTITCPIHGDFNQVARAHTKGSGCPQCGQTVRKTLAQFIEESRKVHGNRYSYDQTNYVDGNTKVSIRCPSHGRFQQNPGTHLSGSGCPGCSVSGFYEKKVGFLYIVKNTDTDICKLGISNSPDRRLEKHCLQGFNLMIALYKFNRGSQALRLEKEIKAKFELRYANKEDVEDGHTETFHASNLGKIAAYCSSYSLSNNGALIKTNQCTDIYLTRWSRPSQQSSYSAPRHISSIETLKQKDWSFIWWIIIPAILYWLSR